MSCKNFTHRDLIRNAMPLISLSENQWQTITRYAELLNPDEPFFKVLSVLIANQAKLEVINNYCCYFGDKYDGQVDGEPTKIIME